MRRLSRGGASRIVATDSASRIGIWGPCFLEGPVRRDTSHWRELATHKTDRNDARGLAHLARTGFFKPDHVKSLRAHALRSLISARKKLVGQRVTLENQIRGLAVVFGVRLPRALTVTFIDNALRATSRA